ncbi:MAG: TIGR02757 family protein [Fibrobacteres bacterium]|nr:TIGR02757 family protein [Fibrobacterota bacterium]
MTVPALYKRYHRECFIADDPLIVVKKFKTAEDIETAAFYAALLSYGRVEQIIKSLNNLFDKMEWKPALFAKTNTYASSLKALDGFKHRFNNAVDMALLTAALNSLYKEHGTLEAAFMAGLENDDTPLQRGIVNLRNEIVDRAKKGAKLKTVPQSFTWMVPSAEKGTCKRLCMYLRWMARPADCIDFGLWKRLSPSRLIIPVDTHIARISIRMGLTKRKNGDWLMAEEITESLRKFDPKDPVKYDFALCSAGKMEVRGRA